MSRVSFSKDININSLDYMINILIDKYTFVEICKIFREIIYRACLENETELVVYLHRKVSSSVDLLNQTLTNNNKFDWQYLYEKLGK